MNVVLLLSLYCTAIVVASLVGGYLPLVVRLTHRHLEMAISFVSGVILGVGLLHLLPDAVEAMHGVEPAMAWMLGGFLLMFFLDRFFHFHLHEAPAGSGAVAEGGEPAIHCHHGPAGHAHHHAADSHEAAHAHGADAGTTPPCPTAASETAHGDSALLPHATFSWTGAAVGMTIHSIVEGIGLAAAVDAEIEGDMPLKFAGLGAFLAIALHKPLDSLTVGTLMTATAHARRRVAIVNLLFALATPLGVLAFYAFALRASDGDSHVLGPALAFAAGAFVCIASSDLLPELHFHSHDRVKLSACLLLGVALSVGLLFVEHHDHGHAHGHEHDAAVEHGASLEHDHEHEHERHEPLPAAAR